MRSKTRVSHRARFPGRANLANPVGSIVRQAADEELRRTMLRPPRPTNESRRYWGSGLTPGAIETAIRAAANGSMQDLTDLSRETASFDGHLSAVVGKRLNGVAALEYSVTAAPVEDEKGSDTAELAQQAQDLVKQQLACIPNFQQRLKDLAWGIFDGRSALEIIWEGPLPGPVRWKVKDLAWIHPRRLSFGPERELRVVDGNNGGNFAAVGFDLRTLPHKFIQFLPRLYGDYPEREGLALRLLYWAFFKRFGQKQRMILLELFSKPWRIIEQDKDAQVSPENLDDADDVVDSLGASTTARLPKGMHLVVTQPGKGAGEVSVDVLKRSDEEMSKVALGQTGTTDSEPTGLGNGKAWVQENAEWLIRASDARAIAEVVEDQLTDAIVERNMGPEALAYAPKFDLLAEPPADRTEETERLDKALRAGLTIKQQEAYERAGWEIPSAEDVVITLPESRDGLTPPRPEIISPAGEAPLAGERVAAPATANEAVLDILEVAEATRPELVAATLSAHICCAAQPASVNGSQETLVADGVERGAKITAGWANHLVKATPVSASAVDIYQALNTAEAALDLTDFAQVVYEATLRGIMLGALDSHWERESGREIKPATFAAETKYGAIPDFLSSPFDEAIKAFDAKAILDADTFYSLDAAARRRSFTVARMASQEMLADTHRELARLLKEGTDLREFRDFARQRLESAGWEPASPSHVETIYRTNIATAHASGSYADMTQPSVLAAFPYWQRRTVGDGPPRQRPTHKAVHGWVFRQDDKEADKLRAPSGYNCRCRDIPRTQRWVDQHGARIHSGAEVTDLPDRGFTGGVSSYIAPMRGVTAPTPALPPPVTSVPAAPKPRAVIKSAPAEQRPGLAQPDTLASDMLTKYRAERKKVLDKIAKNEARPPSKRGKHTKAALDTWKRDLEYLEGRLAAVEKAQKIRAVKSVTSVLREAKDARLLTHEQDGAVSDFLGNSFGAIRAAQRGQLSGAARETFSKMGASIEQAIQQNVSYEGELWRGISVTAERAKSLMRQTELTWGGQTASATIDLAVAKRFASSVGDATGVLFRMRNGRGLPVSDLTAAQESEVLQSGSAKFRVLSATQREDGTVLMELEQL